MDRRLRTNLVLVAVLAAAALLIIYGPEPGNEPRGVPLIESDEKISRIAVFEGNGETDELRFALERSNETWELVAPVELPAAMFQVDALLGALREPASRRYPMSEADPAALGLAAPQWRVEVDARELRLGDRTALGVQRYVQMGDHVYLVNDLLSYRLQRNPFDYASKNVLPEDEKIQAIQLPSGQRLERSGNSWMIEPEDDSLSTDALQATISAWRNARALRVAPANSVPRDGEVQVEFANGEMLRFGVEIRDDELLLSRADPAVTYILPLAAADELLQVTRHSSTETDAR
ncbi:MAG TPA: DUF4340 domain-containing protein [Gammaproteobacteria bacterium]